MAIKQFYLQAIPFHDSKILIKADTNKIDQIDEVAKSNWIKRSLKADELKKMIDMIIPRSSWSDESWKFNNGIVDNDVSVSVENGIIISFSFRSDLTQDKLVFLKAMLSISKGLNLNLFTIEGDISSPPYKNIQSLIKKSNSFKYLSDPESFIKKLTRSSGIVLPYVIVGEEE